MEKSKNVENDTNSTVRPGEIRWTEFDEKKRAGAARAGVRSCQSVIEDFPPPRRLRRRRRRSRPTLIQASSGRIIVVKAHAHYRPRFIVDFCVFSPGLDLVLSLPATRLAGNSTSKIIYLVLSGALNINSVNQAHAKLDVAKYKLPESFLYSSSSGSSYTLTLASRRTVESETRAYPVTMSITRRPRTCWRHQWRQ